MSLRLLVGTCIAALGGALMLLGSPDIAAHGGGLDSYGCHHNRKEGGYHCHRGSCADRSFGSQSEMLKHACHTGGDQ